MHGASPSPANACTATPAFLRSLLAGAAVGVAVIAALVLYRQTLYSEDAINYYSKQSLLFNTFAANGFYGVRTLLENLLAADYKMFMNLFISLPYLLLPRTVNAFMLSYALTCFVPALGCAAHAGAQAGRLFPRRAPRAVLCGLHGGDGAVADVPLARYPRHAGRVRPHVCRRHPAAGRQPQL